MKKIVFSLIAVLLCHLAQSQVLPLSYPGYLSSSGVCAITTTSPLPAGAVGTSYSTTIAVNGSCTLPITCTVISGSAPAGLTFASGCTLSGTPTTAGTSSFTVQAADSASHTPSQLFSLTVNSSGGETNVFTCGSITTGCPSPTVVFSNASGAFAGGGLSVPNTTNHSATGAWYPTQVNIAGGFDTTFNIEFTNLTSPMSLCLSSPLPCINGLAFVVQNSSDSSRAPTCPAGFAGLHASADANIDGVGAYNLASQCPIGASVFIKFEPAPTNATNAGNYYQSAAVGAGGTGAYANFGPLGALSPGQDMFASGLNLYQSNENYVGHVTYDSTNKILTLVLKDNGPTSAGPQYRASWNIDVATAISSSTAYIGFTGGIGPNDNAQQYITSWVFNTGLYSRLTTPTFSVTPGQYTGAQSVTLTNCGGSVTCYYTTNGIAPSTSSTAYTGSAISVASTETLSVVATETGFTDSLVAQGYYAIQSGGSPYPINLTSGITSALVQANGSAVISGGSLNLTDTASTGEESGSGWFVTPVSVSTFTKTYTLTITPGGGYANGIASCEQNPNSITTNSNYQWASGGPNAVGNTSGFGIGGTTGGTGGQNSSILQSVCIVWDTYHNEYGLYENGAFVGSEIAVTGISLNSTTPIVIVETFNGTNLAFSATQGSNNLSHTFTGVNVTSIVGASTAYAGFTGSTGGVQAKHAISAWTMTP